MNFEGFVNSTELEKFLYFCKKTKEECEPPPYVNSETVKITIKTMTDLEKELIEFSDKLQKAKESDTEYQNILKCINGYLLIAEVYPERMETVKTYQQKADEREEILKKELGY